MPIPRLLTLGSLGLALMVSAARADEQQIAPGTAQQDAVVINTGANGICESTAGIGDIQAAPVGSGTPFRTEIRCGPNKIAETTATGDDTQLIAVGAGCRNANNPVVDTGPDGVANSTAVNDDTIVIATGVAPANTPCVITGGNGTADTAVTAGDDTLVLTPVGTAQPNAAVVLCGPNGLADTTANNVNTLGDDVQVVPVGNACSANDVIVDSGANGVGDTRAEGSDLVLKVARPLRLSIGRGQERASKTVKFSVTNVEFGATAPLARTYKLDVAKGSCPGGTVNQVDTDASTPGLQATSLVTKGGRLKGSFVVTVRLEDVTSVASNVPFRCTVNVDAIVVDPNLGANDFDDGASPDNNSTTVAVDVSDKNDL